MTDDLRLRTEVMPIRRRMIPSSWKVLARAILTGPPRSRRAEQDRHTGAMPSFIQDREDGDELWTAFRLHVGNAWNGTSIRRFVAGWDANNRSERAEAARALARVILEEDEE